MQPEPVPNQLPYICGICGYVMYVLKPSPQRKMRNERDGHALDKRERQEKELRDEIEEFSGHIGMVTSVAVSQSGRFLASGSHDGVVRLWELSTGRPLKELRSQSKSITSVLITPQEEYVIAAGNVAGLDVWELPTGEPAPRIKTPAAVQDLAISPDGRWLLWLHPAARASLFQRAGLPRGTRSRKDDRCCWDGGGRRTLGRISGRRTRMGAAHRPVGSRFSRRFHGL